MEKPSQTAGAHEAFAQFLSSPLGKWKPWSVDGRSPQGDFIRAAETHSIRIMRAGNRAGKEQPVDEPVLTPTGWRRIDDLRVGDVVIGGTGKPCTVLGVFPQGEKEVVRIVSSDGAETRCGWDHLWRVRTREERFPRDGSGVDPDEWRVLSTREIVDRWGPTPSVVQRCEVPFALGVDLGDPLASRPVDPYVLGALLGDGCLTRSAARISSRDPEIIVEVARHYAVNPIRGTNCDWSLLGAMPDLRAVGVAGKRSWEKSVPRDYLWAPASVRLAVLQGLMDTDGSTSRTGGAEFSTTSPQLRDDVVFLVRSLGGLARAKPARITHCTHKGERRAGRPSYRVTITAPGVPLFRLPRKLGRVAAYETRRAQRLLVRFEPAGKSESVCIQVSDPTSTYVTRDWLVTHNTYCVVADALLHLLGYHPWSKFKGAQRWWFSGLDWDFGIGQVLFPTIKELLPAGCVASITWRRKAEPQLPLAIYFRNGSLAEFKSADGGARKYQGAKLHGAVMDEEHDQDVVEETRARLLNHDGYLSMALTPVRRLKWIQALERDPSQRVFSVRASTMDAARAGILPLAPLQAFADSLPEAQRRVRVLGDYVALEGRVYPEFSYESHVCKPEGRSLVNAAGHEIAPWPIPKEWPRYAAMDFGFDSPAAVVLGAHDTTKGRLVIYRVYYSTGIRMARWAELLRDRLPFLSMPLICDHDANGRAELEAAGLKTIPAVKAVAPGLELVSMLFRPGRDDFPQLVLAEDGHNDPVLGRCDAFPLRDELEHYHYAEPAKNGPDRPDRPVKKRDHACDAMRYLAVKAVLGARGSGAGLLKRIGIGW